MWGFWRSILAIVLFATNAVVAVPGRPVRGEAFEDEVKSISHDLCASPRRSLSSSGGLSDRARAQLKTLWRQTTDARDVGREKSLERALVKAIGKHGCEEHVRVIVSAHLYRAVQADEKRRSEQSQQQQEQRPQNRTPEDKEREQARIEAARQAQRAQHSRDEAERAQSAQRDAARRAEQAQSSRSEAARIEAARQAERMAERIRSAQSEAARQAQRPKAPGAKRRGSKRLDRRKGSSLAGR